MDQEQVFMCAVAKQSLKIWDGEKYLRPKIGDLINLPKEIAELDARLGFVRIIGPKATS